ncbi:hypothetical protein PM082_012327 [Marasmius tenuissimus]|nr:hypothetical protein PM082_012327 [Marasmius tenuissimus]
MAPRLHWNKPQGLLLLDQIVSRAISSWSGGLRPFQATAIARILDGEDVLCCTATGGGKSALFMVPILAHLALRNGEIVNGREAWNIREKPVGIVVTPTKGLAGDLVCYAIILTGSNACRISQVTKLKKVGLPVYAYTQENLAAARREHRNIVQEITSCNQYRVIFVDPEHLCTEEWRKIAADDTFGSNLVFACAEEAHLINEWGTEFRKDFWQIGKFFRGRLHSHISVFAITATLAPGEETTSVCTSLGLFAGQFHLICNSNKQPNMQFIMQPLKSALSGTSFPELLPIISSGRKAVIHCASLQLVYSVFVYLMSLYPDDGDYLRRV